MGQPDPVFDPISAKTVTLDPVRAASEVQSLYNNGSAIASAYSGDWSLIRSVLFDYPSGTQPPPATPPGLVDPTSQPILLTANTNGLATGNVISGGGLLSAVMAADPFLMQYRNGFPLNDVAWGRQSPDTLSQQTRIVTPYPNQLQSSNAASHVLRTMEQVVIEERIPGALEGGRARINVVISSDVYVAGLAGLLNLHWLLPGYQPAIVRQGVPWFSNYGSRGERASICFVRSTPHKRWTNSVIYRHGPGH